MALCTFTSLISLAIYLFGSMPHMDFGKYAYNHGESDGFDGSIELSLLVMRLPSWFFIGIDLLTVTSREVLEVRAMPLPFFFPA